MIDGSVIAAYLAAAGDSRDDSRVTSVMSRALDRLDACVVAKMGSWPANRLRRQPPRAADLEVIGSALARTADRDEEFARNLAEAFEELESSGAHFLAVEARQRFRDDETEREPVVDRLLGSVVCDGCGEVNRGDAEFCRYCNAFLGWNLTPVSGSSTQSLPEQGVSQLPPSPPVRPRDPAAEQQTGTQTTPSATEDSDRDGLTDVFENLTGSDSGRADTDGDSLIDSYEASLGTDPLSADTDLDGVTDGLEVGPGLDPFSAGDSGAVPAWSIQAPSQARAAAGNSQLQAVIDRAFREVVTEGRVLFNPPERMRQGRLERVEVAIARTKDLDEALRRVARGRGRAHMSDVDTSPFMAVELKGPAFDIVPLQATASAEQVLNPMALWEFDVTPKRSGPQRLQVCVAMRIPIPERPDERASIPVLERPVRVTIDPRYGSRQFLRGNWQWLIATVAGLGGAVAAWLKLFHGGN